MKFSSRIIFFSFMTLLLIGCGSGSSGSGSGNDSVVDSSVTISPVLKETSPINEAEGVAVNTAIFGRFSGMQNTNLITFTLHTVDTLTVPTILTENETGYTITPINDLDYDTLYNVKITTVLKDVSGETSVQEFEWSFTTGYMADITPPTVISSYPLIDAIDVPVDDNFSITFSEPLDLASIDNRSLMIYDSSGLLDGTVTYANNVITVDPIPDLEYNYYYELHVSTTIKDLAGNVIGDTPYISFIIEQDPDFIPSSPPIIEDVIDTYGDFYLDWCGFVIFPQSIGRRDIYPEIVYSDIDNDVVSVEYYNPMWGGLVVTEDIDPSPSIGPVYYILPDFLFLQNKVDEGWVQIVQGCGTSLFYVPTTITLIDNMGNRSEEWVMDYYVDYY